MSRRSTWTPEAREHERNRQSDRRKAQRRAENPALGPFAPRVPQGPMNGIVKPHVPEGLELAGLTTHLNKAANVDGQHIIARRTGNAAPEPPPPGFLVQRVHSMQRGDGSEIIRNQTWSRAEADRWEEFKAAVLAITVELDQGPAKEPAPAPPSKLVDEDLLTLYPLGDPHIGMLAWAPETGQDFDTTIATRDLAACVGTLIDGAPPSGRGLIVNLGDFFHAQDDTQKTPQSGHKLDVDTRHPKIFEAGLRTLIGMIDAALLKHARVRQVNIPGNHDPNSSFMISNVLRAWYRNEPRVDISSGIPAAEYDVHGRCLLGFFHGPSMGKVDNLPGVMATDARKQWGDAEFCVWHTGDIHHLTRKEFPGCVVESHRTMATQDAWHKRMGYRAAQSLSSVTYHREFGEVTRHTVSLRRVRAGLKVAL